MARLPESRGGWPRRPLTARAAGGLRRFGGALRVVGHIGPPAGKVFRSDGRCEVGTAVIIGRGESERLCRRNVGLWDGGKEPKGARRSDRWHQGESRRLPRPVRKDTSLQEAVERYVDQHETLATPKDDLVASAFKIDK